MRRADRYHLEQDQAILELRHVVDTLAECVRALEKENEELWFKPGGDRRTTPFVEPKRFGSNKNEGKKWQESFLRLRETPAESPVFVKCPEAPSESETAGRAISPVVTAREVSGGTRSAKGSGASMRLMDLSRTWFL